MQSAGNRIVGSGCSGHGGIRAVSPGRG